VQLVEDVIVPVGWPTWVLSNHDNVRHRSRYGSERRARAAAVLLLTLRGTPFLYAGEELGLEDAAIPEDREVDPGGRDGCRAPIPWDATPGHGWGVDDPWLPWPPDPDRVNAESLRADETSILHLYRRAIAARRTSPALAHGDFRFLPSPDGALVYERTAGDDRRAVVVNFSSEPVVVDLDGGWQLDVSADRHGEGAPFTGTVPGDGAVILRPAPA
jgi:alpha-glucosidase